MSDERTTRERLERAVDRIIAAHDDAPAPAAPQSPAPRRGRAAIWIVALVAACLRLVMVLAPPADTYPEGGRIVENGVVVQEGRRPAGEELMRGSATKDFLDGTLLLPHLQDYQVQPFWGGTLVFSVMAVPLFALLGPTIVALRLTGLAFAAAAAGATFAILDRFAGRRAAWIGGLLMALPPPGFAVYGVIGYGTGIENQTWSLLTLGSFLAFVHGGLRPWRGFLTGLLAGFTIYCGYIALPLVGLLFAWALWLEPGLVRRRAGAFALAGFAIGLWPSIWYNLTHAGDGLNIYGSSMVDHLTPAALGRYARQAFELVWNDLPGLFYFQPALRFPLGRAVLLVLLLAALAAAVEHRASLARLLRPRKRDAGAHRIDGATPAIAAVHPAALCLAFLPVYSLAYVVTDFRVDHEVQLALAYRYLLPFLPFLTLLAGFGLDALARRSSALRRAAIGTAAALCALFLASDLAWCRFDKVRENWSTPGYSDVQFARSIMLRYGGDLDALTYVTEGIVREKPPEVQELFFFVMAQNYKYFLHPDSRLEEHVAEQKPAFARALAHLHEIVPDPYKPFFEPLAPGEPVFGHRQMEEWRRARDSRR